MPGRRRSDVDDPAATLRPLPQPDACAMSVLPFRPKPKPKPKPKADRTAQRRGATLCRSGFHRFEVVDTPFDVRAGRLLTRLRCARCGAERTELR
jgi:hypothetical protein